MAKSAKTGIVELTATFIKKTVNDILGQYGELETARGSFMNRARRHRERIAEIIAQAEAKGIPPKVTKLHIKIEQTQSVLKGLIADLDKEEQIILREMSKQRGKTDQLSLFGDLGKGSVKAALKALTSEDEDKTETETVPTGGTASAPAEGKALN